MCASIVRALPPPQPHGLQGTLIFSLLSPFSASTAPVPASTKQQEAHSVAAALSHTPRMPAGQHAAPLHAARACPFTPRPQSRSAVRSCQLGTQSARTHRTMSRPEGVWATELQEAHPAHTRGPACLLNVFFSESRAFCAAPRPLPPCTLLHP